jgi:two-component system sensor histidine kinase FlrB
VSFPTSYCFADYGGRGLPKELIKKNLSYCLTLMALTVQMLPAAMTSLPMPASLPVATAIALAGAGENSRGESEQFLLQAFRSFAEAADSLERSYGMLRSEVGRLRGELEQSNAGLERSLEENRRMRQHLDRILEGLPCGVLVARADGTITLLNPAGRRLLGAVEAPEFEDRPDQSLLSIPAELRDLLQRARSGADEQEQCLSEGHGGERWLAVRHAAMKEKDAEPDGTNCVSIFILRDVSDAKRLVRERDKLRREQALAEMSAILAHEIRNPLGSLELFAGLLADAGLSAECHRWVEHVQAGLRTLAATVNNVLHFHSLPAPQRVSTDLGQLLDWAGGFLVPMARQARVELSLHNRLHGVCLAADRHRLEQVLLNLALNAFRAMPGGGWVEISGHRIAKDGIHEGNAAAAVISVSDTGPGVGVGDVEKIFEPGFSTHTGSPGLGLAVCRKIVEQHGGSLAAANRAGAGASFTLTFPLVESGREFGVAEIYKEASQTRPSVACALSGQAPWQRAARPDPSRDKKRLARDDSWDDEVTG